MLTEFPQSGKFLQSGMHSLSRDTRFTAKKKNEFFSLLRIWSHLITKFLIENFVF